MSSISNIPLPLSIEPSQLSPLQNEVADKLRKTTNQIVKDVITVLVKSKSISVHSFIEEYVLKQDNDLSKLDRRTQLFSQQMLAVVNEDLNKIPSLSQSFDALASFIKDPHIRAKLVSGIALPSIKKLVLDLDAIKTSIIDDINACYMDVKPSWKDKLLSFIKIKCSSSLTWQKTAIAVGCALTTLIVFYSPYDNNQAWRIRSEAEEILIKPYQTSSDFPSDTKDLCLTSCRELEKCSKKASSCKDYTLCEQLMQSFNSTIDINKKDLQDRSGGFFVNLMSNFIGTENTNQAYKEYVLQNGAQNYLAKIDRLIQQKCCFHIKIDRDSINSENARINFQLKSHCQIA